MANFGSVLDAQHLLGQQVAHLVRGGDGIVVAPEEHGCVHHQMQVVAARHRVVGEWAGIGEKHVVGAHRLVAHEPRLLVVAAQHINVARHMVQVARVRRQGRQRVGRGASQSPDCLPSPSRGCADGRSAGCCGMPCSFAIWIERSHTCTASTTSDLVAGAPVLTFQRRRGVRVISASM